MPGFFYFYTMRFLLCLFVLFLSSITFGQDSVLVYESKGSDSLTKNDTIVKDSILKTDTALKIQLSDYLPPAKKMKWNVERVHLLFGIDFSPFNPMVVENDIFHGPYYPVEDSSAVWLDRDTKSNLSKSYKSGNIQFSLQANFWKGLFFGMNYQFFTIRKYKKEPNRGNLFSKSNSVFFIVSAQVGYVFEFLKNKCLQIHPSIRIGGYTGDGYYDSGKGSKFYFGADLRVRYLIKRKFGIGVGVDYDFLYYKQKGYSDLFSRNTYQKTTFSNVHLNVGISYNVTIRTKP
ncbi:MAG: hypothetical protein IPM95_09850 [Sphingobacteriales bacterium]|nr:hypothetical protein [Sphingobacteriales bacterium]